LQRGDNRVTTPNDSPPVRPLEPDPADCCGEGCVHCILDVYDAVLERYEAALAEWRARQTQKDGSDVPSASG